MSVSYHKNSPIKRTKDRLVSEAVFELVFYVVVRNQIFQVVRDSIRRIHLNQCDGVPISFKIQSVDQICTIQFIQGCIVDFS